MYPIVLELYLNNEANDLFSIFRRSSFEVSVSSRVRLFDACVTMICNVYIRYLTNNVITVWNNSVFAIPHAIVLHYTVLGKSAPVLAQHPLRQPLPN